ncbi:cytochrome c [uncultured Roseobacter sp.]|uniref:c-type cytochrome n=1 Tax=uncultured Roseobacter sp. TaxID=114847 RepID=UPI002635AC3B|nr:cytochrome c [uncultured Roseobacter sp.]
MKRSLTLPLVAALALTAVAGTAIGDGHSNKALEDAIKARKAQMTLVGYNTGLLGAMAKGETPYDAAAATAAASTLAAVAKLDRSILWLEGSVQGTVDGTRAKADIWTDAAGFEKAAAGLEAASADMVTAAGTDLASLQAQMKALGDSCGTCHKAYRGPKN